MTRDEISRLLPLVFQRTLRPQSPLPALLDVMVALHAPSERVLQEIDSIFDPLRTPPEFVPLLAQWVDLAWIFDRHDVDPRLHGEAGPLSTGLGRLRELVAAAPHLAQWRGTRVGLVRFLETATGVNGFEIEDGADRTAAVPRPFHLVVRAPAGAAPDRALIQRIIEVEKPAYVTYDLQFAAEPTAAAPRTDAG